MKTPIYHEWCETLGGGNTQEKEQLKERLERALFEYGAVIIGKLRGNEPDRLAKASHYLAEAITNIQTKSKNRFVGRYGE